MAQPQRRHRPAPLTRPYGACSRLLPPAAPRRGDGPRLARPPAYGEARPAAATAFIGERRGRRGGRGGPTAPDCRGRGEGSARLPAAG